MQGRPADTLEHPALAETALRRQEYELACQRSAECRSACKTPRFSSPASAWISAKVEATQASPYRHNTGSASSYSTPFQEAPRRGGRTLVTRNTPSGQYTVRLERTMMETDGVEAPR